ncbi:endoglucanase [Opitutaceae bacterium TAV1]|nr:endoglucanase [Opitutaceae bacterium TAV1]
MIQQTSSRLRLRSRPFSLLPFSAVFAFALCVAVLAFTAAARAGQLVLLPRDGPGLGTVSAYGGVTPAFAPGEAGRDTIVVPASGKNEVNLVWTFWSHRQPTSDQWPAGQNARTTFTLQSETDATLHPRLLVRTGEWSAPVPGPPIVLKAGQPAAVELALPETLSPGPVQTLRIIFASREPVPALTVTDWSAGNTGDATAAPGAETAASVSASSPAPARAAAPAGAGDVYKPLRPLFPLTGEGTVSSYGGTSPIPEKDAAGQDVLRVPETGKNEVNLVWTFYRHRQPPSAQWPSGPAARARLTLTSASAVTLRPRLLVRAAGEWTAVIPGEPVDLAAGQPATIELALPSTLPEGPVENLRIILAASRNIPELIVTEWSVGEAVAIALYPPGDDNARTQNPVNVAGRTAPGVPVAIEALGPDGVRVAQWTVTSGDDGRFAIAVDRAALPAGPLTLRATTAGPPASPAASAAGGRAENGGVHTDAVPFYLYPLINNGDTLPVVVHEGRHLLVDGKPWAFLGLNYTRFLLEFSLCTNYQLVAEEMRTYGAWGLTALRVPLHLGMFQPAPGVFPDDPDYAGIIKSHKLDPEFFRLFDYLVAVAGHYGIRIVIDWHEMPTDPYRYFVGGNNHDKGTGKPGTGIAWLYDPATKKAAEPGDPRFNQAIADTNRWLARHYRGNGNILGFEAPYNEPHSLTDSADLAWRRLTADSILPIVTEDPTRLTFGMAPAWGHSNVLPSATWMLPDHLTGVAPHHYLGNGPIAIRPDARSRKEPWLARDVVATFDHAFFAVSLPHSAAPWPVWNGESGEHGYRSFLPELSHRDASSLMIEAQLVQAYAAGWTGSLGWTLTGNPSVYRPVADLYETIYRRFAPVYAAGPLDQNRARVLFVQNPAAVPVANGLNHACVPFARLALDLHLAPVHYMTDDQLLGTGLVQMAVGLEQVEQIATGLAYKAAIVDTRNLDARALELLRSSKIPLLVVDDATRLAADELASFLEKSGMEIDRRTPPGLQLIEGPGHLLVYRRSGEGAARVYPRLTVDGSFRLIGEDGGIAFAGTAATLAQKGIAIDLPAWRTAIFRIARQETDAGGPST